MIIKKTVIMICLIVFFASTMTSCYSTYETKMNSGEKDILETYIYENAEEKLAPYAGFKIDRIQPIEISNLEEKGIVKIFEAETKLDLPDDCKFESGGEVEYIYSLKDYNSPESKIRYNALICHYSQKNIELLLEQLENNYLWTETTLSKVVLRNAPSFKKIASEIKDSECYVYEGNFCSLTDDALYCLYVLITPLPDSNRYMVVFDGVTNNRTFRNGTVTIK